MSAVNYGLTGIVSDPKRKFRSEDEYYVDNLKFSSDYFSGRISETDREAAEISLEFSVGDHHFRLTRGVFELEELRDLVIYRDQQDAPQEIIFEPTDSTPKGLNDRYNQAIVDYTGLHSFSQFVFLQHFVFTFDERRHLVFWDQKVLEQSLYLAFGLSLADANKASSLRREIEKAESLARNFLWQGNKMRTRYSDLKAALEGTTDIPVENVLSQYDALVAESDKCFKTVEKLQDDFKDGRLRISQLSAERSALEKEYEQRFVERLSSHQDLAEHPIISSSLRERRCGLCGSTGEEVVSIVEKKIHGVECPLCNAVLRTHPRSNANIDGLKEIDRAIEETQARLDNAMLFMDRIEGELKIAQHNLEQSTMKLDEFERVNKKVLNELKTNKEGGNIGDLMDGARLSMLEFYRRRDEQYQRRDEARYTLNRLQTNLEKSYSDAEQKFVPLFKNLAHLFLGIDLDVKLQSSIQGVGLALDIDNMMRRQEHQLSESQRFFVDIALRMALAQYVSDPSSRACLLIDTPEGALDIAYESRAGEMIARFVEAGYQVIMTANINTSQLLKRLAEKCGSSKMKLCRMTSWAPLSDVQTAEMELFERAYRDVEAALKPSI